MKLFSVFKKDLLILLRDRAELAVLFLMPLAFIIPISLALGSGDGYGINSDNTMPTLTVVDYDRGPSAQVLLTSAGESLRIEKTLDAELIETLGLADDAGCAQTDPEKPVDSPDCIEKAGREMLRRSWRTAMLIIPAEFSQTVESGEKVELTLVYDPAGDSIQMQQIEGVVEGAAIKISVQNQVGSGLEQLTQLAAIGHSDVQQALEAQAETPQPAEQKAALRLEKVFPEDYPARLFPDTYQQTIPGYTVMFVFFIMSAMAASINAERLNGTFRRLMTTPIERAELLGGKMLAIMTIGLIQVTILFGAGALFFKLQLGTDPLAFFLLTIALVATAASIGLAASTTRLKSGLLSAPLIIAALLGGCMFPLDLMPPVLRALSRIVPHSWALTGYQNLMVRGQGIQEVFPQIAALSAFALVFFFIAIRRFDFLDQEAA